VTFFWERKGNVVYFLYAIGKEERMELQELLIKKEFIKQFGFLENDKMEDFLEYVKKASTIAKSNSICLEDEALLLEEFDLPKSVLLGLKHAKITSLADLKVFMLFDEEFKKKGVLGIRGIGEEKTKDLIDTIPGLREFCKAVRS
jgi:hypothetical protein